jgi:hypothetical protein
MVFSNFTLPEIRRRFGLTITLVDDLFATVPVRSITARLAETLEENVPLALAVNTEKARSEFIVAPVLTELRRLMDHQVSLFSGVDFPVDPENGLAGVCDFLVTRSPQQLTIEAPVITLVEAKNDNIKAELPQCIAEMLAARLFNERENASISTIYGVVTTGSLWNFLKLTDLEVRVDAREHSIEQPDFILSVLAAMADGTA